MPAESWMARLLELLHQEAGREPWTAGGARTELGSRPLRVFLCHASPDKEFVRPFADLLEAWGHDVWLDERKLVPGQEWEPAIRKAVRETDMVIVVLSRRSVTRTGYGQKEIRLALEAADERPEGSIFLIPFRLDDTPVPDRLASRQWLDAGHPDARERLRKALAAATRELDALAGQLDPHLREPSDWAQHLEGPAVSRKIFDVLEREIAKVTFPPSPVADSEVPGPAAARVAPPADPSGQRTQISPPSTSDPEERRHRNRRRAGATLFAAVGLVGVSVIVLLAFRGSPHPNAAPAVVAVGADASLYVSEPDAAQVVRIGPAGRTTFAGTGTAAFAGDGGPAVQAALSNPTGLATTAAGAVYIADTGNSRVRMVGPDGRIKTVAGTGTGPVDTAPPGTAGSATQTRLGEPYGVAVGRDGGFYVLDRATHSVYEVRDGGLSPVAGTGHTGFSGDAAAATRAALASPRAIAATRDGTLYIADTNNQRIREVREGIIRTVAGTGRAGSAGDDGPARSALLSYPEGVAAAPDGSLYVADTGNQRVRRIAADGVITTVAGTGAKGFAGDGGPARSALLSEPTSVAVGPDGSVYVVDAGNKRVRRITPQGTITSVR